MNIQPKTIFTGDNLPILRGMNSASVDLIYLDPPFNSNANYAAPIGSEAAGAEFKDTWTLDDVNIAWLDLIETKYPAVNRVIHASMTNSDKSYLIYMAVRLLEMHRVLKDTGSLYLHCDPTMSHYLKLLLDAIFGRKQFRNEIVWSYRRWPAKQSNFQRMHDVLLRYSKTPNTTWNQLYEPLAASTLKSDGGKKIKNVFNKDGKRVRGVKSGENSLGAPMRDVWNISVIAPTAKERVGYPTQKPLALLERIIKASSNPDDVVFDPFCGCATTLVAADRLQRNWIGIDISPKAAELVVDRIKTDQGLFESIIHRADMPLRTDLGDILPYNTYANKALLYGQQAGNCNGCRQHFQIQNLEVDHIIAVAVGGTDHIENLQLLCGHCNRVKGDRGQAYLLSRLTS